MFVSLQTKHKKLFLASIIFQHHTFLVRTLVSTFSVELMSKPVLCGTLDWYWIV